MENEKIKIDVSNWRIRIDERSKDRMKLQIKLSKDEAVAFKNFSDVCKPEGITDDDFLKTVFITGVEEMNKQLSELVQKYALENQEDLASSGISVIQGNDGVVRLQDSDTMVSGTEVSQPANSITKFEG